MNKEDGKLIADYMGWKLRFEGWWRPVDCGLVRVDFDLNDAALCVQKMQKRGDDYVKFIKHAYDMAFDDGKMQFHTVTAWLFNADNFFTAFVEWRKGNEPTNT
jgi:hypothetical protein